VADERRKRRRGHRRKEKLQYLPGQPLPVRRRRAPRPTAVSAERQVGEEETRPGLLSRITRRSQTEEQRRRPREREHRREPAVPRKTAVSTLDFWRRGRVRPLREEPPPKQTIGRLWRRFAGFYFPPWVPVVTVMLVVFAILGGVFFIRGATARPRIGDHWHTPVAVFIGQKRQPNIPEFEAAAGSPGTHGDGIYHVHPFAPLGEGAGSSIGKYFTEGGGKLSSDEIQIPGQAEVYRKGEPVPEDGRPGVIRILRADAPSAVDETGFNAAIIACDGLPESAFEPITPRYIPKGADCIRIVFAPEGEETKPVPPEEHEPVPEDAEGPLSTPTTEPEQPEE